MRRGPVSSRYQQYAADIHSSGRHLLALINDLLDLPAAEATRLPLSRKPVDLDELTHSCREMVRTAAEMAGVSLTAEVDPACSRRMVDELRLRQIIINLLSNAIRFTPAGAQGWPGARQRASASGRREKFTPANARTAKCPISAIYEKLISYFIKLHRITTLAATSST